MVVYSCRWFVFVYICRQEILVAVSGGSAVFCDCCQQV
ncbi:hypothetical protein HMPREF1254_1812 [Prevotella sp. BV3P1]|nr:hypothetical protein HMPREF1254_1812 [Prevotella sp. BV3P1]